MYHRATPLCPKLSRGQNSVLLGPWPLWSPVELGLFPAQKVPRSKLRPQVSLLAKAQNPLMFLRTG